MKITSCTLVISFLFYQGCYDTTTLTRQEFVVEGGQIDISVLTNEGKRYEFEEGKYQIVNDSLSGVGMQKFRSPLSDRRFRGAISLANITLIETKELNPAKSVLLAGGIGLAVAGIIALTNGGGESSPPPPPTNSGGTKMSCPFIYTFDGSKYHLESETFAGAVLKGLERPAYDVLHHLKPVNGTCRLNLVNARQETEYVNELKLIAVDHPTGTIIIPDGRGMMHTIRPPVFPTNCADYNGRSMLKEVAAKDNWYWETDLNASGWTDSSNTREGLILEFAGQHQSKTMKLVVSGKNTDLGYFALAAIFQLKGDQKLAWQTQLETNPAECAKFRRWLMREGMLHVSLWQNGKWMEKTALMDVGPGVRKDQVAVLDVSETTGSTIRIKLESTIGLWRVDQVYADYSPDTSVRTSELSPKRAINEHGQDVTNLLAASDEKYYTTVSDQFADIVFDEAPRLPGTLRTYVAKTRGFYYQWLESKGRANEPTVRRILDEPGFGTRMLMPQWLKQRAQYQSVSDAH